MNMKIKCTQCGCDDLAEVSFPYEAQLLSVTTAIGLAGESFQYELEKSGYTKSYICTKCGHFEFFNPELAKVVLGQRKEDAKVQSEIKKLEKQVLDNNNKIKNVEQQINSISEQLKSLDITIRQSNELKAQQQELNNKLKQLKDDNNSLIKQENQLKKKLKEE